MTLNETLAGYHGKKYGGRVGNAIGSVFGTVMAGVLEGALASAFNPYHIPSKIKSFKSLPQTKDKWTCLHDIVSLGTYIGIWGTWGTITYNSIKHPEEAKYHLPVFIPVFTNFISTVTQWAGKELSKDLRYERLYGEIRKDLRR